MNDYFLLFPSLLFLPWRWSISSRMHSYRTEKRGKLLSSLMVHGSWTCLPLPSWIEDDWVLTEDKEDGLRSGFESPPEVKHLPEKRTVFLCGPPGMWDGRQRRWKNLTTPVLLIWPLLKCLAPLKCSFGLNLTFSSLFLGRLTLNHLTWIGFSGWFLMWG